MNKHLDKFPIQSFQNSLIHWFKKEQRDLPWRKDPTPYEVWVSEIMLQQTKVETVIPYYKHFLSKFPTLDTLATAEEQEVLKAWEGLGYYSRARNLQNAVREVVEQYGGSVPDTKEELGNLKGVGPYTQGAILSIAFQKPEPAVDGNVMRVLSRTLLITDDIAKGKTRSLFESIVRELISKNDPSAFNQGLMELGALVCTPKSPSCLLCPVQEHCRAFKEGIQESLPVKSSKKVQAVVNYYVPIVKDDRGRVLIQQRPSTGLLANLWEFPMIPIDTIEKDNMSLWYEAEYGLIITNFQQIESIRHVFSHRIWDLQVGMCRLNGGALDHPSAMFIPLNELETYPFPVSHQKIKKLL
ncbi:A/G-specific adenine glycosylase [Bacillaceae bacterium S4-13-58]